ncbi:hypothetical protein LGH70_23305 [Hymenobacter sp. BT635]|uniref:Uncharacterized protein n=1 Tax=Hymenobacter nitidus TaxID=2880929 RepID=A0ABS8AKY8_9BACT|nr:hypothetical protein [Hymenobacter nitidus]MCB2380541.1 hypothetical protein [Hymenobacter nitidus]
MSLFLLMSRCPVPDLSLLDWLPVASNVPAFLGLPLGFAAYLKLLPPLGIDRSVPMVNYSFAVRTVEQLNARAAFWTKHGIVTGQPAPDRLTPISYRQVAAEMGVAYTPEFGNVAIQRAYGGWPPHLGSSLSLEVALVQQLVAVLGSQTDTYFFGSEDEGNYRWDTEGFPTDWLEQGKARDLVDLYQQERRWPTYTFAADRAWCLYQGEDQELVLGCSLTLAQQLLTHPTVEAWRLTVESARLHS